MQVCIQSDASAYQYRGRCFIHMEISPPIDACLHMLVFPFKQKQNSRVGLLEGGDDRAGFQAQILRP